MRHLDNAHDLVTAVHVALSRDEASTVSTDAGVHAVASQLLIGRVVLIFHVLHFPSFLTFCEMLLLYSDQLISDS